MININELIKLKCPNGVEYKRIDEIAIDIYRGSGIKQDEVVDDGIPCVRYGEIYTTYGIWFDRCVSHTLPEYVKSKKYFEYGDILFAITGESVEDIGKSCAYVGDEKCLAGGDIVVLKHEQNPKYLAYALDTRFAKRQKSKGKIKSKVVHSSVPDISKIVVPIPPLDVQNEIADLLDNYAEAYHKLINSLNLEVSLRENQFEIIRNAVFESIEKDYSTDKRILDICTRTSSGGTPKTSRTDYYGGDIPWLRTQEVNWIDIFSTELTISEDGLQNSSAKWIPSNCVIVAMYGATAAKAAINRIPLTTNQACCNLEINPELARPEYVLLWLKKQYKELKALGRGSQNNINAELVKSFPIIVPNLEDQDRIISELEKIEELFSLHISAIKKEIDYRNKQWDFYIEQLFSFKEIS